LPGKRHININDFNTFQEYPTEGSGGQHFAFYVSKQRTMNSEFITSRFDIKYHVTKCSSSPTPKHRGPRSEYQKKKAPDN